MTSLESGNIDSIEKQYSQAEIDKEIEIILKNSNKLLNLRDQLQIELDNLKHKYSIAGKTLDGFKTADIALSERLSKPTITDSFYNKFASLFNDETTIDTKSSFLNKRTNTGVARSYYEAGKSLRQSVSDITETKDILRELMGEDLSFRGGKIGEEETLPREESINKIDSKIKELDEQINLLSVETEKKREESFEAWKRENPAEWEKLEAQRLSKKEKENTLSSFAEYLETSPDVEDIAQILHCKAEKEYIDDLQLMVIENYLPKLLTKSNGDGYYIRDRFSDNRILYTLFDALLGGSEAVDDACFNFLSKLRTTVIPEGDIYITEGYSHEKFLDLHYMPSRTVQNTTFLAKNLLKWGNRFGKDCGEFRLLKNSDWFSSIYLDINMDNALFTEVDEMWNSYIGNYKWRSLMIQRINLKIAAGIKTNSAENSFRKEEEARQTKVDKKEKEEARAFQENVKKQEQMKRDLTA